MDPEDTAFEPGVLDFFALPYLLTLQDTNLDRRKVDSATRVADYMCSRILISFSASVGIQ
jgi:hypothetical protein